MYNLKTLQGGVNTNIFFPDMKSIHGNTCFQIFSHKVEFSECYPKLNAKGDSLGETLENFVHNFGAPEYLKFDGF